MVKNNESEREGERDLNIERRYVFEIIKETYVAKYFGISTSSNIKWTFSDAETVKKEKKTFLKIISPIKLIGDKLS